MKSPRSAAIGGARGPARAAPATLRVFVIALSAAAIVFVARDAAAFWLCVPAALVASTGARSRGSGGGGGGGPVWLHACDHVEQCAIGCRVVGR